MEFNLLPVINADGKKINFDVEFDFPKEHENGVVFLSPVSIKGGFQNIGGNIELKAKANAKVRYVCDRCCDEYDSNLSFDIDEKLREEDFKDETDKNPDVIYFRGNNIELDELIMENIFLSLPLKRLCNEECKGLCIKCGANLNLGDCGCDTRVSDPRFDALDKFFE